MKLNRNNTMLGLSLLTVGALPLTQSCTPKAKQAQAKKPNIVFILADDLGIGDLSCYGQATLSTPNIDLMAVDGMKFTNIYTGCAVCAPSRASILTGKHTGHTSVRGNEEGQLLKPEETTIPEVMKMAGYYTGMIGKWGIGHPPPPNDPKNNGVDYFYGYINMWHAHNYFPDFLYRNGVKEPVEGNVLMETPPSQSWSGTKPEGVGVAKERSQYSHDLFEADALKFMEEHKDTSFFLYLTFTLPHANNEKSPDGMEVPDWGEYADKDWPDQEKGFASMITRLDNTVGKINAKLKELGLADNTIIVFTSDNGAHREGGHSADFFDSNGKYRGYKRDLYEGGIITPFLVVWPGKVAPSSTCNHLLAFWDILPTFCDITGVKQPAETDGISFLPSLIGKPQEQKSHKYLYWEFYENGGTQAAIRDDWKLVKLRVNNEKETTTELYNISEDIEETNNVAAQHPDIVKELDGYINEAHTPFAYGQLLPEEFKMAKKK